ncbi:hypothetical protein HYPSUDRAFT_54842 [Hypholoma sublateritium FD-334 SS-4]|uniref:Uncharacterized protein n=1 Tax=Hypholoma sublateritium (strain FD-334 SS-4) TaxID=945553 RepID=A0A0D2L6D0_HYPSF|nr:hypothetical protein HYPSUDRAFT_54842 [Hypholoma sublateritium FD-334 SS-4]
MFSLRIISLAAVLLGSIMVNAAPAVTAHHVEPGNLYVAKPAHFEPQHPGDSGPSGHRNHPVVALSHPDANGYVPVAVVSHNHPEHMGRTQNAQHFDEHTHAAGHGGFETGSRMATARPVHVHVDDLHHVNTESGLPARLHHEDTHNLKEAVYQASGKDFNNPRHRTPTPPWRQHQ